MCPYHSWAYALGGSRKTAKGFKGTAGFDDSLSSLVDSLSSLVELPVTDWHGLIFVDDAGLATLGGTDIARIAEVLAASDPDRAGQLINYADSVAQGTTDEGLKAEELYRVAIALAASDPERAERTPSPSAMRRSSHRRWRASLKW